MTDANHVRKLAAILAGDSRLMADDEPATNESPDVAHAHSLRP